MSPQSLNEMPNPEFYGSCLKFPEAVFQDFEDAFCCAEESATMLLEREGPG